MALALLSLGSNLGHSPRLLQQARRELAQRGLGVVRASRVWRTRAVGGPPDQSEFLNQVLLAETSLSAQALLQVLLECEQALGRVRHRRWAARTIDIDLLLYEQQVLSTEQLQLPHPRMSFRRFVLQPAVEIAAEMIHPLAGRSLQQLLDHLNHTPPLVWIVEEVLWDRLLAAFGSPPSHEEKTASIASSAPCFPAESPRRGPPRFERIATRKDLLALARRHTGGEAENELHHDWGVWFGKDFPRGETMPPRLVVAGTLSTDLQNWHKLHHRWQQAAGRVGPHLIIPFADTEHLWQELSAAAWATCSSTILGPYEP